MATNFPPPQSASEPVLRDYQHASKLFVGDNFRLSPKYGFLFHVYIDINDQVASFGQDSSITKTEIGMLAKSVSLPKFNIDVKNYNAYNRVNYVQSKIKYDPVQIAFHDDSADVVRNFWYDYFNYHYRDSDYQESVYAAPHKYSTTRQATEWGYTPRDTSGARYLNSIRIYSLHQKQFSEYVLINPVIKTFAHGEHQSNDTNNVMQHQMTVEFETVLYYYGTISSEVVNGFATLHYDNTPSPLLSAGGTDLPATPDNVEHNLADIDAPVTTGVSQNLTSINASNSPVAYPVPPMTAISAAILQANNSTAPIYVPNLNATSIAQATTAAYGYAPGIGYGPAAGIPNTVVSTPYNGLGNGGNRSMLSSIVAIGAAVLLRDKRVPISREITAATIYALGGRPYAPYSPYNRFPTVSGVVPQQQYQYPLTAAASIRLDNVSLNIGLNSNQGSINPVAQIQFNNYNASVVVSNIRTTQIDLYQAQNQQQMSTNALNYYNSQISAALGRGESPDSPYIKRLQASASQQAQILIRSQEQAAANRTRLEYLNQQHQNYISASLALR